MNCVVLPPSVVFDGGTLLMTAFMAVLCLPQSQFKAILMPILSWLVAVLCATYCASVATECPEVLFCPLGAVGIAGAIALGAFAVWVTMEEEGD